MKISFLFAFLLILFLNFPANAQNSYQWYDLNIEFQSAKSLEVEEISSETYLLNSDNLSVRFSKLTDMEGEQNLKSALENYAQRNFQTSTPATEYSNNSVSLVYAVLTAQNEPANYALGLYCSPDFSNYFICQIKYQDGFIDDANNILQGIYLIENQQNNEINQQDIEINNQKEVVNVSEIGTNENQQNTAVLSPNEPDKMRGMVDRHNYWRSKVGAPPVKWSKPLADFAQNWANQLQKRGCNMEHRPNNDYGENIYYAARMEVTPQKVVDKWATEISVFKYEPFTGNRGDGHYTQVVWSTTQNVGCAMATCGDAEIWVCNYDPAGNMLGDYPYKK